MITDQIIALALQEDLSLGDITSDNIFTHEEQAEAVITAKEDLVLCGMNVAKEVFSAVDPSVKFLPLKKDGDAIKKGEKVLELKGAALSILKAERTALNFMQRMSGIATASRKYAEIGKKYGVMIVDTRKTQPGLRRLDKYAVRVGGARNHRISLADSVMIKDNHIAAAGSITAAVNKIKAVIGHTPKIEVETTSLDEVKEALQQEWELQKIIGYNESIVDGYTGFIFQNRYGLPLSPHSVNRAIDRICEAYIADEKAKALSEGREPVLIRHFSAHNLRHTFCTRFCENETNIKVIQEIMGHADIETTMNIYAEATKEKKMASFAQLDGKIKIG